MPATCIPQSSGRRPPSSSSHPPDRCLAEIGFLGFIILTGTSTVSWTPALDARGIILSPAPSTLCSSFASPLHATSRQLPSYRPLKQRYALYLPTQSFFQCALAILHATIPTSFSWLNLLKWPYMTTVLYSFRTQ